MASAEARARLLETYRSLGAAGLLPATSGNVSVRLDEESVLITPSGLDHASVGPDDLAVVRLADGSPVGRYLPSSETPLHLALYRERPEVGAVVHTHSRYATALACLGMALPPVHYLLTVLSPDGRVPLAPYALYGSTALAEHVLAALSDGAHGCLMAHHGALTVGEDPRVAAQRALVLEEVAAVYHTARQLGEPRSLTPEQLREAAAQLSRYRPRRLT